MAKENGIPVDDKVLRRYMESIEPKELLRLRTMAQKEIQEWVARATRQEYNNANMKALTEPEWNL